MKAKTHGYTLIIKAAISKLKICSQTETKVGGDKSKNQNKMVSTETKKRIHLKFESSEQH